MRSRQSGQSLEGVQPFGRIFPGLVVPVGGSLRVPVALGALALQELQRAIVRRGLR